MVLKLHIAEPVKKLATMLSDSAYSRTLLGAGDSSAAMERIHYGYGEDEEFEEAYSDHQPKPLPRMLVALADFESQKGTTSSWSTKVEMVIMIECLTLEADRQSSLSERYMIFLERVQGVADDLREAAATGTKLNLTDILFDVAPQQADPKKTRDIGEVWWCVLRVKAGG